MYKSTQIYTNLHKSTQSHKMYTNGHKHTNVHKSIQIDTSGNAGKHVGMVAILLHDIKLYGKVAKKLAMYSSSLLSY